MKVLKDEILDFLKTLKPKLESEGIISLGLFGSRVKGIERENSDVDILYETTDIFINKYKGWEAFTFLNENIRDKISKKFNIEVDMFDLNSSSPLKEKIKKEAIYV